MEGGSAPDPAAGNKEHVPAGMDWFVVPIPAPLGAKALCRVMGRVLLFRPVVVMGGTSAGVRRLPFCRTLDMLTVFSCKGFCLGFRERIL